MASASLHEGVEPDTSMMKDFLAQSIGQAIHLVAILPDSQDVHAAWFGSDTAAAVEWAAQKNSQGWNVYWTVNGVRVGFGRKPKKTDIVYARFLHCDIDPPKAGPFDRAASLATLTDFRHPPSFVVDSGNGWQAFWRLSEPAENLAAVEGYNRRLSHAFGGDHCHNIDRLMRVPGSVNYPDKGKRARGRVPALATMQIADEGECVDAEEMHAVLPEVPAEEHEQRAKVALASVELRTLDDLGISPVDMLHALVTNPAEDRSKMVLRVAGLMARRGFSNDDIAGVLLNPEYRISDHPFDQPDPVRSVRRALERIHADLTKARTRVKGGGGGDGGGDSQAGPSRRTIRVRAGELPRMATEGEMALIESASPIYARGGALVRPVVEEVEAARGGKTRIARLCVVTGVTLCDHLARVATWVKFNSRKQSDVVTDVPSDVALTIIARDGEWQLPKLAGVITTPTLRPDGTILSEAGYDAQTQLLLMGPPALPPIPESPTREDALVALQALADLLVEFPFVDEASKSVALSALITPVVRGAMSVAPLHAISAPVPGSGKSYIIDLASVIATGDRASVIAAGRNEEETEKRLVAALIGAQPIVSIDNVNGELGGDMLCQMIERPLVDVRILGQSKLIRIESRATTYATGNNIRVVGDMTRRVLLCSLDPDMERPELRTFKGDPVAAVSADRGRYIAAALTIVRAYVVAGCPGVLPPLASFGDWSKLVRSALVWLGCVDPLETMNKARGEDPVTSTLTALFSHWYEAADGTARTAGQVKQLAFEKDMAGNLLRPDFAEALSSVAEGRGGEVSPAKLGRYLASYQGRIVDGLKLTCNEDGHAKQKLWKVSRHD